MRAVETPRVQAKRLAGCEGKARLKRKRAIEAARKMRERGERVHEYRCRFCGWMHIGGIG